MHAQPGTYALSLLLAGSAMMGNSWNDGMSDCKYEVCDGDCTTSTVGPWFSWHPMGRNRHSQSTQTNTRMGDVHVKISR